jgi:hypothetical protein
MYLKRHSNTYPGKEGKKNFQNVTGIISQDIAHCSVTMVMHYALLFVRLLFDQNLGKAKR